MSDADTLIEAAMAYVADGVPVFPIIPRAKNPITGNGFYAATTEEDQIGAWWIKTPLANVGIPTGARSGFWVLDVDGPAGVLSLSELEKQYGQLPKTRVYCTGSGGFHYLWSHVPGVRNGVKFMPGLDVRGEGGYIVAPPSIHASGKAYRVLTDLPVVPAPGWLMTRVLDKKPPAVAAGVGDLREGGRNAGLASMSGRLRRAGLDESAIRAAMHEHNRLHCEPPLEVPEVDLICRSISRYPVPGANGSGPLNSRLATLSAPSILVLTADVFCSRQWPERPTILGPMRERSIGTIYAEAGVGKSLLVHSLVVAIARGPIDGTGTPIGGLDGFGWTVPEARKVLLVDGELPAGELAERINAWNPAAVVPANLLVCSDDASGGIPSFMTQEGRDAIESHLDGVAAIFMDNVSTLLTGEGDANAAESWQAAQDWLLSLRRRGLLVQLVDHAGKTGGRGPRGTSRKLDIVDYAIELSHARDWQADNGCRFQLKFTKSRGVSDHRVIPRSVILEHDSRGVLRWAVRTMGEVQREEALEMLSQGASVRDVVESLDVSKSSVYRWRDEIPQSVRSSWKNKG